MAKIITGSFLYTSNLPVASGILYLTLSQDAVIVGTGQVAPLVYAITLNASGAIPSNTSILANDELSPVGTVYEASVIAPGGGKVWGMESLAITGTSPININNMIPSSQSGLIIYGGSTAFGVDCTLFAGANEGEKIQACIASLPVMGGVANAVGFAGGTIATDIFSSVTKNVTLYWGAGTFSFTLDTVIPVNIAQVFSQGSVLAPASGKTLTLNGSILADNISFIGGAGTVIIGNGSSKIPNITAGTLNNILFVDGVKYTTIQAAVDDAGANVRLVIVPSSYAGANPTSVPANVTILDLRRTNGRNRFQIWDGASDSNWETLLSSGGGGIEKPLFYAGRSITTPTDNQANILGVMRAGGTVTAGKTISSHAFIFESKANLDTTTNGAPDPANLEAFGSIQNTGLLLNGYANFLSSINPGAVVPQGTIVNAYAIRGTIQGAWPGAGFAITNAYSGYFDQPNFGTNRLALWSFGARFKTDAAGGQKDWFGISDAAQTSHKYLRTNGSAELEIINSAGNTQIWKLGNTGETTQQGASIAPTFQSTIGTVTAPFSIASTTNVPNLNASSLNGATFAAPGAIGGGTPGTGAFTTGAFSGQVTSTLATGSAPFVVASTTVVGNLNVSQLLGATWAAPGTIGSGTPNSGAFTTGSFSGQVTSTVATGSAPLVVASITKVTNLNADLLDDKDSATAGTATTIAARDASGRLTAKRFIADGTALINTDFVLSAGWGDGPATIGTITGSDQAWQGTITASGVGQGANPTITVTFKDGTGTNAPICTSKVNGGTGAILPLTDAPTATTNVITFVGTPVTTLTYQIISICIGRV